MQEPPILEYLKSLPHDEPLFFFQNPGNTGDAMIALATYQLFARAGLKYRIAAGSQACDPAGGILVYSGGGNLVEDYHTARDTILKYYPHVRKLVILPHTIRANEDLLASFRENVDILCREPISYDHVKRHAPHAKVFMMDDLAFHLDPAGLLVEGSFARDRVPFSWKARDGLFAALLPFRLALGRSFWTGERGGLNAFRKDLESSGRFPRRESVDLATLFSHPLGNEAAVRYISRRFFRVLDRFQVVRTDRLHVCIAAALLGKRVEFYANNNSKCQAVYRYSIQDRYPNVRWMG